MLACTLALFQVVALISGGKDSVMNMMMCEKYGHEIVVLANLHPAEDSTEELDSFMYQTVTLSIFCTRITFFDV
jgi:diphthamide synthase (EF-2-diphthine--ammonia ligase)